MTVHMLFITAITIAIHSSTDIVVYATELSGQRIVMACVTALVPGLRSDIYIHIIIANMYL